LTIPTVSDGSYRIEVVADAEVRGCGVAGAEILLWTYVNEGFFFATQTAPWPGDGGSITAFDAEFSSAEPGGASKPVTGFKGELRDRDGASLPGGTVIEAYVGDTLCGVTSLRYGGVHDMLYTLAVAGPESVAGCERDATLTFRIDGAAANETATNDFGSGGAGHELNLTVK
jgi:hypothetical protein